MPFPSKSVVDELKRTWTDRFVTINPARADLQRYANRTGRVVTVSYSGRAIVDFSDGAWIDIDDFASALIPADGPGNYDGTANTAQKHPVRH